MFLAFVTNMRYGKFFFPKTSLEGLATWSKKAKIDQNRRGGRMTVA